MTNWSEVSRSTIAKLHMTLADDITFKDRKAAVKAAYPFGQRAYWPYKAWCKAQREYLAKHDPKAPPPGPLFPNMRRDPVSGRPIIE